MRTTRIVPDAGDDAQALSDARVLLLVNLLLLAAFVWYLLQSLTSRITEAADPANWPDEPEVTVDDPTLLRHVRENDWSPGISAYDVMR